MCVGSSLKTFYNFRLYFLQMQSYCQKHSISSKKDMSSIPGTGSDEEVKKKQRKDMTSEEKTHARAVK